MRTVSLAAILPDRYAHGLSVGTNCLLDSSTDCIKAVSLDGRLLGMNPEGICLMEIEDFSALQGQAWSSLWPDAHRSMVDAAVVKACTGSVARFSADCPTAKGTPKHWDVVVSPVHNLDGELVSLLSISRDVTMEITKAQERALVTRELAHRIKNLFAVVDGVIGMSARSDPHAKPFADSLRARIDGLGRAVSYVYAGNELEEQAGSGHSVHGLLKELLNPFGEDASASTCLLIGGDDQPLSETSITPLALIFNELATNALKYGALAQPDGAVTVTTARVGDDYEIRWIESGALGVAAPLGSGFGTNLVDRTVNQQLGGQIARDWRPEGLGLRITVPVARLAPA